MKLTRHVNRRSGDKTYYKNSVDLSPHIIHEAGWRKGDKIDAHVKGGNIILKRRK